MKHNKKVCTFCGLALVIIAFTGACSQSTQSDAATEQSLQGIEQTLLNLIDRLDLQADANSAQAGTLSDGSVYARLDNIELSLEDINVAISDLKRDLSDTAETAAQAQQDAQMAQQIARNAQMLAR